MFKRFNLDCRCSDALPSCLRCSFQVMVNKILLLQEMGVKRVSLQNIQMFNHRALKSTETFKMKYGIPRNEDIVKNIFNNIGASHDIPKVDGIPYYRSLSFLYKICMIYYKTCHLKLYYKSLIACPRKFQSFRELTSLLDILQNKCQLSLKYLNEHPYLLRLFSEDLLYFMSLLKDINIAGMDIIDIIKRDCSVLQCDPEDVKELIEVLEKLNLTHSLPYYIKILTLNKDVFMSRYNTIMGILDLRMWLRHPHFLGLIYYFENVMERVHYIHTRNYKQWPKINWFFISKLKFKKIVKRRLIHTLPYSPKLLAYVVCNQLGATKGYVVKQLLRDCPNAMVTPNSIERTLIYLKQHYSVEDICKNIHIILYSRSNIVQTQKEVNVKYCPEKGFNFTSSQHLALCLYTIQQKTDFNRVDFGVAETSFC